MSAYIIHQMKTITLIREQREMCGYRTELLYLQARHHNIMIPYTRLKVSGL